MNIIKSHPKAATAAGILALVVLLVAAVAFNRGGLGSVNTTNLMSHKKCFRVDEDTVTATLVYTGDVRGGSISLGATLLAINSKTAGVIGKTTERFTASGSFRKTLDMSVDFDESDTGSADVECYFTLAREGWHLPGR